MNIFIVFELSRVFCYDDSLRSVQRVSSVQMSFILHKKVPTSGQYCKAYEILDIFYLESFANIKTSRALQGAALVC